VRTLLLVLPIGICGYCVGALNIPHHSLPWESPTCSSTSTPITITTTTTTDTATATAISTTDTLTNQKAVATSAGQSVEEDEDNSSPWDYPTNLASPLEILIEASNGASDYGKIL